MKLLRSALWRAARPDDGSNFEDVASYDIVSGDASMVKTGVPLVFIPVLGVWSRRRATTTVVIRHRRNPVQESASFFLPPPPSRCVRSRSLWPPGALEHRDAWDEKDRSMLHKRACSLTP
jgi:hypothetical protein